MKFSYKTAVVRISCAIPHNTSETKLSIPGGIIVLEQIAYVAQIFAAVGVMLSLFYVGRQLQQTNAMSRSTLRQSMSGQMMDFAMSIASSPELAESFAKMQYAGLVRDDATDVERAQIVLCYAAIIEQIHLAYNQQKEGILSQKELEALHPGSNTMLTKPYLTSIWPIFRGSWPPDFVDWFERRYPTAVGRPASTDRD